MEIKRISEGVSFAFHKTERFKTSVVSVSLICPLDEKSSEEIAMIENLQREDLNPVEEALGYKNLMEKHTAELNKK